MQVRYLKVIEKSGELPTILWTAFVLLPAAAAPAAAAVPLPLRQLLLLCHALTCLLAPPVLAFSPYFFVFLQTGYQALPWVR